MKARRNTVRAPGPSAMGRIAAILLCVGALAVPAGATAGEADVIAVEVTPAGDGTYRFDVTVRHADEGWDHYADRFDVVAPDGTVLGVRTLFHPHVEEQPFTRSLSGVRVPDGVATVTVRAHDSVHGLGGAQMTLPLPGPARSAN